MMMRVNARLTIVVVVSYHLLVVMFGSFFLTDETCHVNYSDTHRSPVILTEQNTDTYITFTLVLLLVGIPSPDFYFFSG